MVGDGGLSPSAEVRGDSLKRFQDGARGQPDRPLMSMCQRSFGWTSRNRGPGLEGHFRDYSRDLERAGRCGRRPPGRFLRRQLSSKRASPV